MLALSFVGHVYAELRFDLLSYFSLEFFYLSVFSMFFIFGFRKPVFKNLTLHLIIVSIFLISLYVLSGFNFVAWLALIFIVFLLFYGAFQDVILSFFGKNASRFMYLINALLIVFLYVDLLFFSVSKNHISVSRLGYINQVCGDFVSGFMHFEQNSVAVILTLFALVFFPLLFCIKNVIQFELCKKTGVVNLLISFILFVSVYAFFDFSCTKTGIERYLSLRPAMSTLYLPEHPFFRNSEHLKGLITSPFQIDYNKCYPEISMHKREEFKNENVLFLIVKSLRKSDFNYLMPNMSSYAKRGLVLNKHQSVSNGSLSAMHSIFNASLPLNIVEQLPQRNYGELAVFLKNNGYTSHLIAPETEPISVNQWVAHHNIVSEKKSNVSKDVIDKIEDIIRVPGKKFVCAYLYNTHFNYYYPEEDEMYKPVADEGINIFAVEPKTNNPDMIKLKNRYNNSLVHLDRILGEFFDRLDARGILLDTLVVFIGDHGESFGEGGLVGHFTGYHKKQYEVPAFSFGIGLPPETIDIATTHADFFPLITERSGLTFLVNNKKPELSGYPLLQLDDSVMGRLIVRREDKVSIFDLTGNTLKWVITADENGEIRGKVADLYRGSDFKALGEQIAADRVFIKERIGMN